ncbi:MAG: nitronate monooxygenase [Proteobacteria bacterium]|nr:nitronate monooxygenase [Pseudomonadota bacterium]
MSSALHTPLCDLLGCRVPIVQTGMGWVATPELVAGACNAGAFGFLAAATIRPEDVDGEIEKVRALTDQPFGVNFLMDAPGADTIVDAIVRRGVRAAGYNRSPDATLIERLKAAGVVCVPTCGSARHAAKAEKLGADVVIVQGSEGGGHTGTVPTSLLVPQVVDALRIPVVAAGGFRDGRGLVAALAFGAAGIAMGTRFLLTAESPVPDITTARYLGASIDDVIVTRQVDGLPQRVLRNELVDRLESAGPVHLLWRALRSGLAYRRLSGASVRELLRSALSLQKHERLTRSQMLMAANAPILARKAMLEGDPVEGYLPSGTVAGVIEDRPTCAELVGRMVIEAERTLKALGG